MYIFTRSASIWVQRDYVKGLTTTIDDWLGGCIALSADGATVAIGSRDLGDAVNQGSGAVYVLR